MPDQTRSTTLGGFKYEMKLLGGRYATAAGVLVAGPGMRALDELFSALDVKAIAKKYGKEGLDGLDLGDLQKAHLPVIVARLFETLGIDGVQSLADIFAAQTTVWLPSEAAGDTKLYATPLSNRAEDHWVGRFPLFVAWLTWGVWANGFFDVSQLGGLLPGVGQTLQELSQSRTASTGAAGSSSSPRT